MANQTYQLVVTGDAAGQFVQNVFHYRMDDNGFSNRLAAAQGLFNGWFAATMHEYFLQWHPSTYTAKSVKVRRRTNGGGPEYVDTQINGETGTGGTGMQASANGPVLIWNTDGGPRRIGKTFVSGIAKANVNAGEITAAFLTDLIDNANQFITPFAAVGGGAPFCTFCIPRSSDVSVRSLVTNCQVGRYLGVQRRRQLPV